MTPRLKGPELWARNENARRWRDAPLFVATGIVPLETPEEAKERIERRIKGIFGQLYECEAEHTIHGFWLYLIAKAMGTPQLVLEKMDLYRWRTFPKSACYTCGYWRNHIISCAQKRLTEKASSTRGT